MSTKKDKFSKKDKFYMEVALNLAKSREGLTGTNPSVGCVIVKNEKIISIGQTSFDGRPHAEINAINNTIDDLKGATMYVTLEPCSHYGVTPPCTRSIIKSKFKEVIYSIIDIDKRVKGKTLNILKSKNIKARSGLLKDKINKFYIPYFFNKKNRLPYVSGKIAISKNNLIYSKEDKRITNSKADKYTHLLRFKNDSILISYKTLNKDNPKLNCRLRGLKKFSPKRIILDNELKTNIKSYVFKTANKENTIFFYNEAKKSKIFKFKQHKITLIKSAIDSNKRFNLSIILKKLYNLNCRNILVEGGNNLTSSFIKDMIFNQFFLFEGSKNLSKSCEFLEFKDLGLLKKKYKKRLKIKSNFGKDVITLYKK